jgi:hypothetical protein
MSLLVSWRRVPPLFAQDNVEYQERSQSIESENKSIEQQQQYSNNNSYLLFPKSSRAARKSSARKPLASVVP